MNINFKNLCWLINIWFNKPEQANDELKMLKWLQLFMYGYKDLTCRLEKMNQITEKKTRIVWKKCWSVFFSVTVLQTRW